MRCFIASLIHWHVASVIHWFTDYIDSLIHWFIHSGNHWFIASLLHCFTDLVSHWARIRWFIVSLIHWFSSFFDSLLISLSHCFIDLLIHWCNDWLINVLTHRVPASLTYCFVASLIRPVTDSVSDSLILWLDDLWILSHWFIDYVIGSRILGFPESSCIIVLLIHRFFGSVFHSICWAWFFHGFHWHLNPHLLIHWFPRANNIFSKLPPGHGPALSGIIYTRKSNYS